MAQAMPPRRSPAGAPRTPVTGRDGKVYFSAAPDGQVAVWSVEPGP
ncbi:MAG: hypothetical protein L0Z55_00100 [Planctomycetes bacterium]|nr:hypothetical protein [Planctomycetota bacterium]